LFSLIPFLMLRKGDESENGSADAPTGPDDFLLKPFKSEELVEKVRNLILITSDDNLSGVNDISSAEEDSLRPESESDVEEFLADSSFSKENEELFSGDPETEPFSTTPETPRFEQPDPDPRGGDEFLAGLDEAEEKSLYETEDVIPLTGESELSEKDRRKEEELQQLDISSTEEEIPEEEINLSGLLEKEDIESGMKEIKKRSGELDEIFGLEEESEPEEGKDPPKQDIGQPVDFFEENREPTGPPIQTLPAKELEALITSSLKNTLGELNEKIVREELKGYLDELTPKLIASIEKILWDVMPGLAESLLKKEIERIKNGQPDE
ncbi:MAG: hypothetical protein ACE5FU_05080, partial [Nitrospinota bacterium]